MDSRDGGAVVEGRERADKTMEEGEKTSADRN